LPFISPYFSHPGGADFLTSDAPQFVWSNRTFQEIVMKNHLPMLAAVAALITGGVAFAADPPAAPAAEAPAATPAAPAAIAEPAAVPAPAAAVAAPAEPVAAKKPVRHVSACTRAIEAAEHALKRSQGTPQAISSAWQQIEAAKQARKNHDEASCKSDAMAATHEL
jgi:hypothetical protein